MSSVYGKMTVAEKEVSNYLKKADIWWKFEFPVFVYDENDRPRLWTPDFYIPKLGLYIEVCGAKKFDYKYREGVYEKNGIPVVFLHFYKKRRIWKFFLAERIKEIEKQREIEARKLRNSPTSA